MTEKKRYIKIKQLLGSSYIEPLNSKLTISELLADAFPGENEGFLVSIVEMSEDEFQKLPEFDGF